MNNDLQILSSLLGVQIQNNNIGEVSYIALDERYVVTEHYFTKELEINDLHRYEWTIATVKEVLNLASKL